MEKYKNISELEMINLYKKNNDEKIALYFFNRYKEYAANIVDKTIKSKNIYNPPLEKDDYYSYIWIVITTTLKNFNKESGNTFWKIFIKKCVWYIWNIQRKNCSNSNKILNSYVAEDNLLFFGKNIIEYNISQNSNLEDKILTIDKLKNILSYNEFILFKRIINLRSEGVSFKEISNRINMTYFSLMNFIKDIKKNYAKAYKEIIDN